MFYVKDWIKLNWMNLIWLIYATKYGYGFVWRIYFPRDGIVVTNYNLFTRMFDWEFDLEWCYVAFPFAIVQRRLESIIGHEYCQTIVRVFYVCVKMKWFFLLFVSNNTYEIYLEFLNCVVLKKLKEKEK